MDLDYNPSTEPILSGKGFVILNGERMDEFTAFSLKATLAEYKFNVLYQRGFTTRHKSIDYTGTLTCFKTTLWLVKYVTQLRDTGIPPRMMLQVRQADPASALYQQYGGQKITIPNIVLTGDIPLIEADKDADAVIETVNFTCDDIIAI